MATERPDGHDVTCPSCDEPVGVRASFCMHCGRDLPERVEYDDVTGNTETDDGGETLLGRLRPGKRRSKSRESVADAGTPAVVGANTESVEVQAATAGGSAAGATGATGVTGAAETRGTAGGDDVRYRADDDGTSTDGWIPVPSGRGTDGPTLFPPVGRLDAADDAAKLLGVLALLGAAGVAGVGMSLATTGALLALLAWTVSVGAIARRHTGFDAMRYGSFTLMTLLIFVAFALAFGSEGSGLVAFGLTMVPVGIATLFVAGFGYSMGDETLK